MLVSIVAFRVASSTRASLRALGSTATYLVPMPRKPPTPTTQDFTVFFSSSTTSAISPMVSFAAFWMVRPTSFEVTMSLLFCTTKVGRRSLASVAGAAWTGADGAGAGASVVWAKARAVPATRRVVPSNRLRMGEVFPKVEPRAEGVSVLAHAQADASRKVPAKRGG